MKIKKIFTNYGYLFLLMLICLLPGCSDDNPVTPDTTIDVNGKVVTYYGTGKSGATVIIGNSTTTTAADGSFVINDVTVPYDAKIVYETRGILYEGLSTASPNLNAILPLVYQNSAVLRIQIPPMVAGQLARVFFTDGSTVNTIGLITYPRDTTIMTVQWDGASSITGKIIVLIGTYSGNVPASFDKYGEKTNYTLNTGGTQSLVFTPQDLSLNPGDSTLSGGVISPHGLMFQGCFLKIGFDNNSPIVAASIGSVSSSTFSFTVPTGLPSTNQLSVFSLAINSMNIATANSAMVTPGSTGNVVTLENYSAPISPANFAINIDTNTNFIFDPGTGAGIYTLRFYAGNYEFTIYTASSDSVKIPNLSSYGLGMEPNTTYFWYIEKNLNFNSIDEFVSAPLYRNSLYQGYTRSEEWRFVSAP